MPQQIIAYQRVRRDAWGYAQGFGWMARLIFEPRDAWVGVYWNRSAGGGMLDVYVCLVPFLPIHVCLWGLP